MNSLEQKIKINGIKSGLLLGLILTALGIFSFYFITVMAKSAMLFLIGPSIFSLIIPIILVVLFCFDARKRIGGYWDFKQATTGIFIMFFTAYMFQTIGRDLIFAKLIEPDMVQKTQAAAINATTSMMQKAHIPQAQIDKNVANIQKDFNDQKNVSTGKIVQSIAITIIFIFVLAIVFGAFFKRELPVYTSSIDETENLT
jgi:hypothetical protein